MDILKKTLLSGLGFFITYTFFSIYNINWIESIVVTLVFMVAEFIFFFIYQKVHKNKK